MSTIQTLSEQAIELHRISSCNSQNDPAQKQIPRSSEVEVEAVDEMPEFSAAPGTEVEAYPEGGRGWVVVASSFVIFFVTLGLTYSWGVVQERLQQRGFAKSSTLAFVGSTAAFLQPALIIPAAHVVNRLGNRRTALLGCFLVSLGEFTAGWSTKSVPALFLTQGACFGIGSALAFISVSPLPSQYFNRKRGLATGIVFSGAGLGGGIICVSMNKLLDRVGIEWTLRILGLAGMGLTLPASWFIRPRFKSTVSAFDWALFRDVKFVILFLLGLIVTFPLFVPPFFIPLYAASLGKPTSVGAALLAAWNLSSAVGRIGFGILSDTLLGPVNSLFTVLALTGFSILGLWPTANSTGPFVAFVFLNGASAGGFFSLFPSVTASLFKTSPLPMTMAVLITMWSGGYFAGAPVAGYLLEAYGGPEAGAEAYRPAIYYAGSVALTSATTVAIVRLIANRKVLKRM